MGEGDNQVGWKSRMEVGGCTCSSRTKPPT